ncbi:IS1/IS1595 family N-terminal zinc-binding domain-containing protein [Chlorogloeopsis fritschii]
MHCPKCNSNNIVKNGHTHYGKQGSNVTIVDDNLLKVQHDNRLITQHVN